MNPKQNTSMMLAIATFVPGKDPAADFAEHRAADRVFKELFNNLCLFDLDVPCELYIGHTGTGAAHGGALRDCLFQFEVKDKVRGLANVRETLAELNIAPEHYELAVAPTGPTAYESVWLPCGRSSILNGATRRGLLDEMRKRLTERDALFKAEFGPILSVMANVQKLAEQEQRFREEARRVAGAFAEVTAKTLRAWSQPPRATFLDRVFAWFLDRAHSKVFATARATASELASVFERSAEPFGKQLHHACQAFVNAAAGSISEKRAALLAFNQTLERML